MGHTRRVLPLAVLAAGAILPGSDVAAAREESGPVPIRFMEFNVCFGAELGPAIQALLVDPSKVPQEVGAILEKVRATDFEVRAGAIADRILDARPDVVSLPELALWRSQRPADSLSEHPRPARTVEFDFLAILARALRERGLRYRTTVVARGVDVEMPGLVDGELVDVRLTDRDALLVRKGIAASRPRRAAFATQLVLPVGDGLPVTRSWTSVDLRVAGRKFRVVETHLEDGVEDVQRAQVAEILAGPAATSMPVVLLGDFNTDPDPGHPYSPLVHADILAGGFADSWTEVSAAPGLTWGHVPLDGEDWTPFTYRLDYVFHGAGFTAVAADLVGEEPSDRVGGLWPSDHAGLVVDLRLD